MGKAKRLKVKKVGRHMPLEQDIEEETCVKPTGRLKLHNRQDDEEFISSGLSRQILNVARKQQKELEDEMGTSGSKRVSLDFEEEGSEDEAIAEGDDDMVPELQDLNEEDERALNEFMTKDAPVRRTLADIIMEKITEKQTEIATELSDGGGMQIADMDDRVVEMFKGVRDILKTYRSGRLPKAFKFIPQFANWEQILYLTEPDQWSAAAMYQATRIFTSNLKERNCQRFFNLVLLPRVRDDINEYKKLNFHLYEALKKALFKPGAFFKGFLIPLCMEGTCTLREAIIIGSVLSKITIPVLHSSAALINMAEIEYNGANSIFMRILLDKKYALPYRVVDSLVHHFIKFQWDKRQLPVLWHQSFLTFVQRYKEDISGEQKEALLDVLKAHYHPKITPEIRRELLHSKSRGDDQDMSAS